jgi:hypothetical protein
MGKKGRKIDWSDLEELYINRQLTTYQIAEIKQCHHTTVPHVLRRMGLPKRTQSECLKLAGLLGDKHNQWKGGRITHGDGYIQVYVSPDSFFFPMASKQKYVLEHRLIMAKYLGRLLQPWEVIHHKNGIKDDNRIENLELATSNQNHIVEHSRGYRDGYQKGLTDGRLKQIEELKQEIRLLRWELREKVINQTHSQEGIAMTPT